MRSPTPALILLIAALFHGCAAVPPPQAPPPEPTVQIPILVRNPALMYGVMLWLPEIIDRVGTNIVLVVGHGNVEEGEWAVYDADAVPSPVTWVIKRLRSQYPDRIIVLFVCNPTGIVLDAPGILYGKESLWVVPDRVAPQPDRTVSDFLFPDVIGKASELTLNPFVSPTTPPSTRPTTKPTANP